MSLTKDNLFTQYDERIYYLSDYIDNSGVGLLGFEILLTNKQDDEEEEKQKNYTRKPIKIYINSLGGDLYDMWGLIDIIQNSKTPIYTYCTGYAMSAAFKIFLAGHKRFCYTHSVFMYHQINCWVSGKMGDVNHRVDELNYQQEQIEEFVKSCTEIKNKQLKNNRELKENWYIYADEALKLGIVDEIIAAR